jgi:protein arginine kinase
VSRFLISLNVFSLENVYDRLITGVTKIGKDIALTYHEKFGFLTFSPENLGNTICVSVQMKLPKLSQAIEKIDELAAKFSLTVLNPSDNKSNIYKISSKKRLGVTEFQTINDFAEAINSLVEAENSQ